MAKASREQRDALEASILERPQSPEGYQVLGDWLLSRGDPRGTLIATQCALQDAPNDEHLQQEQARLLQQHRPQLYGPIAPHLGRPGFERGLSAYAELRFGFFYTLELELNDSALKEEVRQLIPQVLRHESSRFLQRLSLTGTLTKSEQRASELLDALACVPPLQTLETLELGFISGERSFAASLSSWRGVELGDLRFLARVFPNLRHLRLHGDRLEPHRIQFQQLERLELLLEDPRGEALSSMLSLPLKRLHSLTLWVDAPAQLVPLATSADALRTLVLVGSSTTPAPVWGALTQTPVLERLHVLDLRLGESEIAVVHRLIQRAFELPHLKTLRLNGSFYARSELRKALRARPSNLTLIVNGRAFGKRSSE